MFVLFIGMAFDVFALVLVSYEQQRMTIDEHAFTGDIAHSHHVLLDTLSASTQSYLFFPGPLAMLLCIPIFFVLGSLIVRSRAIRRRDAERFLEPGKFDLSNRYAEVLANMLFVLLFWAFPSEYSGWMMFLFMGYIVMTIIFDRIIMLRYSAEASHDTCRSSIVYAYMLAMPGAFLAGLVVWWACKQWNWIWRVAFSIVVAIVYVVLHFASVWYLIYRSEKNRQRLGKANTTPYREMESTLRSSGYASNYFNTNPVFCLRSWILPPEESGWDRIRLWHGGEEKQPLCVPYVLGKNYLQPGMPHKVVGDGHGAWFFS